MRRFDGVLVLGDLTEDRIPRQAAAPHVAVVRDDGRPAARVGRSAAGAGRRMEGSAA